MRLAFGLRSVTEMLVVELQPCCCGRSPGFTLSGGGFVHPNDVGATHVSVFTFLSKQVIFKVIPDLDHLFFQLPLFGCQYH